MKTNVLYILSLLCLFLGTGCKKDWLDEKRDIKLIVPTTLPDLRLLMNNTPLLSVDYVGISEMSAGDFSLTTDNYNAIEPPYEKKAYLWQNPFKNELSVYEWDGSYKQIQLCNVVLEALEKIPVTTFNNHEWADLKANALFFRAKAFYNLAELFAPPYFKNNLQSPGIPLRTKSDINAPVSRATVSDTYAQITADLKGALPLVDNNPPFKTQASKAAIYGQLARCYLAMSMYEDAGKYADSCLQLNNKLMDYNTLDSTSFAPFPMFNDEVILHSSVEGNYGSFYAPAGMIQPEIINAYDPNDLRIPMFFRRNGDGSLSMRGFYFGFRQAFAGVTTDEMYFIRSESLARAGKYVDGINLLNTLLKMRFKTGTFHPISEVDQNSALKTILLERRKELLLRGVRWSDLRRLNQDPATTKTLTRTINNQTYTLPPNDPKYTFPLPDYVIKDYNVPQNQGW